MQKRVSQSVLTRVGSIHKAETDLFYESNSSAELSEQENGLEFPLGANICLVDPANIVNTLEFTNRNRSKSQNI